MEDVVKVKTKRLIGNVTADVHTKMKIEAAKADLSMNDVFTMAVMEAFNIDLLTQFNQSTIDKYNNMKSNL